PAVIWNAVCAALLSAQQHVDALTAARTALDLAGPDELPRSLDLALELSKILGRTAQADALGVQRAQLANTLAPQGSESLAALAEHRANPTAVTVAGLWVASRSHPRDAELRAALLAALEPDDAR